MNHTLLNKNFFLNFSKLFFEFLLTLQNEKIVPNFEWVYHDVKTPNLFSFRRKIFFGPVYYDHMKSVGPIAKASYEMTKLSHAARLLPFCIPSYSEDADVFSFHVPGTGSWGRSSAFTFIHENNKFSYVDIGYKLIPPSSSLSGRCYPAYECLDWTQTEELDEGTFINTLFKALRRNPTETKLSGFARCFNEVVKNTLALKVWNNLVEEKCSSLIEQNLKVFDFQHSESVQPNSNLSPKIFLPIFSDATL